MHELYEILDFLEFDFYNEIDTTGDQVPIDFYF